MAKKTDKTSKAEKTEKTIDAYLEKCLSVDPLVIEEEYVRMAADYAYWNGRYADAYKAWLKAKQTRKRSYSERLEILQAEIQAGQDKRVTVKEVEQAVERDRLYLEVQDAEIEADAEKERLDGVLEALRTKREMLISLGAHVRGEMRSGITPREF